MTNGRLVSYQHIVNKFYLDYSGLNFELSDEQSLEWIADFISHANSPIVLENKQGIIEISDGRGKLPDDLHLIAQTALGQPGCSREELGSGRAGILPMQWATDNFHTRYHCDNRDYGCKSKYTYQVNSNYVFTSVDTGFVVMAYKAIPTDVDGYPMVPADQQWLEGATKFLAGKVASILWQRDDLSDSKLFHYERERDWYFAQAVNYSKMPSLDEMKPNPRIEGNESQGSKVGATKVIHNEPERYQYYSGKTIIKESDDHAHIEFETLLNLPT
jgi:hypothetical protein